MLLAGDDAAGLVGGGADELLVERLHRVDVDDLGVDALGGEGLGGLERGGDHKTGGHDGHVGALAHDDALADLELIGLGIVEHGHGEAAEAHVDGALEVERGAHGGAGLGVVGGDDHGHAGDGAHEGDVLVALVGRAVLADRDAGVRGADVHIEVRVPDGVADLLERAAGGEHGERGAKDLLARGGNAGGDADHVCLGDAGVIEALGVGGLELAGLGGRGEVRVQDHEVVALGAERHKLLAVAGAGRDLLDICH